MENKEDFTSKIHSIIISINPDYVKWIKEKLNFANEPSLQERLKKLITELPEWPRKD